MSHSGPDPRHDAVPIPATSRLLSSGTGIKLGLFGINVSAAGGLNKMRNRHEIDWKHNVDLVKRAEAAGFEAAIPFSRFRGFEGETNPWGESFETYTWAAGIAAQTEQIAVFATSHSLTVSPVLAAKQLATIDHISGGRVGLNVVAGWFDKELRMFGAAHLEHDERYEYLQEWIDIVYALWSESEDFDFTGKWISVEGGYQQPKPCQQPRPPVMNAAFSPRGHRFAAQNADIAFVIPTNAEGARIKSQELRNLASEFDRGLQVWVSAACICAETDAAAHALADSYWDQADARAVQNCLDWTLGVAQMPQETRSLLERSTASGGGYQLIGSPTTVARQIAELHDAGIDGLAIVWMDYDAGLDTFINEVMPILRAEGHRYSGPPEVCT